MAMVLMELRTPVHVVQLQIAESVLGIIRDVHTVMDIGENLMEIAFVVMISNAGTVTPTTDTATHALKDMGSTEQIINLVCHVSTPTVNFAPTTCINALPARMAGEEWVTLVPDATHGAWNAPETEMCALSAEVPILCNQANVCVLSATVLSVPTRTQSARYVPMDTE